MSDANRKGQFVWAQTVTVYGSKLTLNTSNFKKSWGLKFYEAFRYGKTLKSQVVKSKLPLILKLFMGCELAVWFYSKICRENISSVLANENKKEFLSINEKLSHNMCYLFFEKENHSDYIANLIAYYFFGKYFYFHNKILTYSILGIGGLSSILFWSINQKFKKYAEDKLKIQEFNLYSTQFNLIPKIFLTSSILCGLNLFLKENYYLIRNTIPMNHKFIYLFLCTYAIAKFSRTISNVTHESLK